MDTRKVLCLTRGGSHAYGLSTPSSDIDLRGVFINTDIAHLVGLKRDEILVEQNTEKDVVLTEFRHALRLLRGANTQMIELLFHDDWISVSPEWKAVVAERRNLIDSGKLYNSLRGYMQGELRLANGERTGKLGGKRKESLDKYGYSPKNFVQLFRLAWAGCTYFDKGFFPVNMRVHSESYAKILYDLKTKPENHSVEYLNDRAKWWEERLTFCFTNRKVTTTFSEEIADKLCLSIYGPLVSKLQNYGCTT